MMDHDKDGIITKSDLRHTYDQVGRLCNEKELDEMIGEASGPINFTQLLNLFATRMSGSGGMLIGSFCLFFVELKKAVFTVNWQQFFLINKLWKNLTKI